MEITYNTVLEGEYKYLQNSEHYTTEIFTVKEVDVAQGNILFQSETSTRMQSGEFLKTEVNYEVSHAYYPHHVVVKRFLGEKQSIEIFKYDYKENVISYSFEAEGKINEAVQRFSSPIHVAAPSLCTLMLMTKSKRLDPMQQTRYTILSSPNTWHYDGEPVHETIAAQLQNIKPVKIKINENDLTASHVQVGNYNNELKTDEGHDTYDVFVSKYFSVPYMAVFPGDIKVQAEKIKNFENKYKNWT